MAGKAGRSPGNASLRSYRNIVKRRGFAGASAAALEARSTFLFGRRICLFDAARPGVCWRVRVCLLARTCLFCRSCGAGIHAGSPSSSSGSSEPGSEKDTIPP
jgi:hypothetical protein